MSQSEKRIIDSKFSDIKVSRRSEGEKEIVTLSGYSAVYYNPADPGTEYRIYSDVVERISRGAFDEALQLDEIVAKFDHEGTILGRTGNRTLRLSSDEKGIRYEIDLPETTRASDVLALVSRGDIRGSSFDAYMSGEWSRERRDDNSILRVRTVRKIDRLLEVGPVTRPAYKSTTAGLRSEADAQSVLESLAEFERQQRNRKLDLLKLGLVNGQ